MKSLNGSRLRQVWALLWHGAVDLAAAAVFLVLLAMLLPRAVGLFIDGAGLVVSLPAVSLKDYLCAAAEEPLGAGFWATAMLLSTLLPTALHLMSLIASPLAWLARPQGAAWRERAAYLAYQRDEPPAVDLPRDPAARAAVLAAPGVNFGTARKVAWWRIRQILLIYPVALAVAGLLLWGLWHLVERFTGPLPAWLLWFATFDTALVEACLPGAFGPLLSP